MSVKCFEIILGTLPRVSICYCVWSQSNYFEVNYLVFAFVFLSFLRDHLNVLHSFLREHIDKVYISIFADVLAIHKDYIDWSQNH